ncbi:MULTISPECIES: DUF4160 domain-containing protein [unclassified Sphingomonas]|jgi:hypothetical protein|uniref:DUF4160 domain-containing protein n=1 Tax=unclassified Sphingomonas TaxID=196159 RepID=UPI0025E46756|nr:MULTISPECIES: DUF4160 domain-containing protein [unclassified Sphingomonas]
MPTVLRIGAFRFYLYSHEPNEPPHIHIDRGDATIKVWLTVVEVAKSRGFRAHETNDLPIDGRGAPYRLAGGVA